MEKEKNHPKHTIISVRHEESNIYACVAVNGTRPQVLTDDVIAGKSIKMNFQFYKV